MTQLHIRAQKRNDDRQDGFFACLATENPILESYYDYDTGQYERAFNSLDMSGMRTDRIESGLQLLRDHYWWNTAHIYGVTTDFEVRNGELLSNFRFSTDPEKAGVVGDLESGVIRNFSISFQTHKRELEREEDGVKHYRITDWEPLEISMVTVGADPQSNARSFFDEIIERQEKQDMGKKVKSANNGANNGADTGTGDAGTGDAGTQTRSGSDDAGDAGDAGDGDNGGDTGTQRTQRSAAAPASAPSGNDDSSNPGDINRYMDTATRFGLTDRVGAKAFANNEPFADFVERLLKETQKTVTGRQVEHVEDASDKFVEGASQAILNRYKPGKYEVESGNQYRGMSTMDLIKESVTLSGGTTRGLSVNETITRSLHTTSDFPRLMAMVIRTSIVDNYREEDQTFRQIMRQSSNVDFRKKNTIGLGDLPDMLKVNEHGEFKRGTFSERGEGYALATYGRIMGFTRQLMINDGTNELLGALGQYARMVARKQSDVAWGGFLGFDFEKGVSAPILLDDGNPVFDASHNNVFVGTASSLTVDSLREVRLRGRRMMTLDGKRRAPVTFDTIIVPPELEAQAEKLVQLSFQPANMNDATPDFIRRLNVIVETRLEDIPDEGGANGLGLTRWYAIDSNQPGIDYAFLAGEEEIFTDERVGFDIDGIEFKVRTDFGAGWTDYTGVIQADGQVI